LRRSHKKFWKGESRGGNLFQEVSPSGRRRHPPASSLLSGRDREVWLVYGRSMGEIGYIVISAIIGLGLAGLAAWKFKDRCAP
jgi:hypothetical protein